VLRERGVGESSWEAVLPPETARVAVGTGQIDVLLDEERFLMPFLWRRTASIERPTIPIETCLRLM
jgi:hypothetical protein